MRTLILTIIMAITVASLGYHNAFALSVDTSTGSNNDGSAKFGGDPDDKIPFPHVADDGTQPSSNFQSQAVGNSGVSFGLTPSSGAPDAFQRAQDRMQQ